MENTMDDVKQRVGDNFDERARRARRARPGDPRRPSTTTSTPIRSPSVGIAFGVGYLLSGALFSRTTFKAASIGGRFALGGLLKQLVAGIGPGMIAAALGGANRGAQSQSGDGGNRGQQH